eukprot:TRINITY_DN66080_c0_g1_i1.p1 TRINITY_DN66080_c0_g1~~TRINITY_DN66080_c0_g1_i1.p1  ORF type:complete len:170 (+),score=57.66 TRINITY_DN66080_c0_g1_i1:86-595(+)
MRRAAALALLAAAAAAGGEWQGFELTFTDRGSVLQSTQISPDGEEWAEIEEGTIELTAPTPGGVFGGLKAKCVAMSGAASAGRSRSEGWCTFRDSDGDMVFEHYEGALDKRGGGGNATFTGGTGKWDGVYAEHTWEYIFSAQGEDWYEGRGSKKGRYRFLSEQQQRSEL